MDASSEEFQGLKAEIFQSLNGQHGPLLGGYTLAQALGMPSVSALRQARHRGRIDVVLFSLPKRQGTYALTMEVADWLARVRLASTTPSQPLACPGQVTPL